MCIGLLAKQDFYVRNIFFRNAEMKELVNSRSFANSGVASVAFANNQPGDEISVLLKVVDSSLGSTMAIGGCLHNFFRDENLL